MDWFLVKVCLVYLCSCFLCFYPFCQPGDSISTLYTSFLFSREILTDKLSGYTVSSWCFTLPVRLAWVNNFHSNMLRLTPETPVKPIHTQKFYDSCSKLHLSADGITRCFLFIPRLILCCSNCQNLGLLSCYVKVFSPVLPRENSQRKEKVVHLKSLKAFAKAQKAPN